MRIISGAVRGKQLLTPAGLHTRPTTDRVKESIFNILQFFLPDSRVLDLFAGSGQLGLECLSRGAQSCRFCDNDREALQIIKENIARCGAAERSTVFAGDWRDAVVQSEPGTFDIILLDPPYGGKFLNEAINAVTRFDILASRGIIVCESAKEDEILPFNAPYRLLKRYQYGATVITTLTRDEK